MEITKLLEQDHETVKTLIGRFESANGQGREELVAELLDELDIHTQLEEELFYPAVRSEVPDAEELVAEGMEEHHVAKQLADEIRGLDPDDEAWEAKVKVLGENVEHHIEEEEGELFPKVRDGMDDARRKSLADEVRKAKQRLLLEDMTVIDLREQASVAGITGASGMKKSELIDALTDASIGAASAP
jgi:hemerythrin superfamily protein